MGALKGFNLAGISCSSRYPGKMEILNPDIRAGVFIYPASFLQASIASNDTNSVAIPLPRYHPTAMRKIESISNITTNKIAPMIFNASMDPKNPLYLKIGFGKRPCQIESPHRCLPVAGGI